VVGLDQSAEMLEIGRRRIAHEGLAPRVELVEGNAERLPFADESFASLTVTYLLRYVDNPGATLAEIARVVRPGGTVASLEFALPPGLWRVPWEVYVRAMLPLLGRLISPGWHEVGRFLGPSIRSFYDRLPLERQLELWRAAGVADLRYRRLSLGGGIVIWGTRR
jgi:demethylmenaquinone methyltransferase/2-methoxy-6-polyprenyl-1,4-benzoquinol methylase